MHIGDMIVKAIQLGPIYNLHDRVDGMLLSQVAQDLGFVFKFGIA